MPLLSLPMISKFIIASCLLTTHVFVSLSHHWCRRWHTDHVISQGIICATARFKCHQEGANIHVSSLCPVCWPTKWALHCLSSTMSVTHLLWPLTNLKLVCIRKCCRGCKLKHIHRTGSYKFSSQDHLPVLDQQPTEFWHNSDWIPHYVRSVLMLPYSGFVPAYDNPLYKPMMTKVTDLACARSIHFRYVRMSDFGIGNDWDIFHNLT